MTGASAEPHLSKTRLAFCQNLRRVLGLGLKVPTLLLRATEVQRRPSGKSHSFARLCRAFRTGRFRLDTEARSRKTELPFLAFRFCTCTHSLVIAILADDTFSHSVLIKSKKETLGGNPRMYRKMRYFW